MRYLVVLKSGIKITINELTKDELENIRNNHGSNVTVGFGTNGSFIEKQAEDPSPFRGGDECRTLFSHPIAIYPLGYI